MSDPAFNLVLYQPQIPNNTGNIGRTAAAVDARLHIIHPIGFDMSEKARRRAGLDYWHLVDCREHASWETFLTTESPKRAWLYTTRSPIPHWRAAFQRGDYLIFGQETGGVPDAIHRWIDQSWGANHRITLPMNPAARSLNLSTVVCAAAYEAMRQMSHDSLLQ